MTAALPKWLPGPLRRRLLANPKLQRILENFGWLFGDRIVRMGLGMLVNVWVARYLGPGQFGLFAYVQAVVALFLGFSNAGLDYIVIDELVGKARRKSRILGTTLALRLTGALLALFSSILVVVLADPGNTLIHLMAAIMGSAMVFQAFDTIDLWFQSQVQSRTPVLVKNAVFLAMAIFKVALVLMKASLVAFACLVLAEAATVALFLALAYRYLLKEDPGSWQADFRMARHLLKASWPLVLSGLTITVFMRIDQIMLNHLGSSAAVGVYAVASRLTEVWYFIPMAAVSSVLPSLVEARKEGQEAFDRRFQTFCRWMVGLAMAIVLPMTFLSEPLMVALYGKAFADAGPILTIHIWTAIFAFLGVAQGPWFVIQNLVTLNLTRTLAGAIVNVSLNILLIPRFGGKGAAVASLVATATANLAMNYFDRRTRGLFWILVRSFNVFAELPFRKRP